jgi:hypothetical protein
MRESQQVPENINETVKAELVGLVERLTEKEPQIAGELLAILTRAGFLQNLLTHPATTPTSTQATPAAPPDPPPAPFEYTDEEIYDRQERAARFRGQRRPIDEGSPWAG